jgi:hypothetical protein
MAPAFALLFIPEQMNCFPDNFQKELAVELANRDDQRLQNDVVPVPRRRLSEIPSQEPAFPGKTTASRSAIEAVGNISIRFLPCNMPNKP